MSENQEFKQSEPLTSSSKAEVSESYPIRAIHIAERIRLKTLKESFSRPSKEFSNHEMVVEYGPNSFLFLYNFGSIVFFNVPESLQEQELRVIRSAPSTESFLRTTELFLLEVGNVRDFIEDEEAHSLHKVFVDRVVVQSISYAKIKISCRLLAESTALDYYENFVEDLLVKSNHYAKQLRRKGRLDSSEDLQKFIGLCLDTKQEIISNLYIVDAPDETWDNLELDRMHQSLKRDFEIDTRYRGLEYKIKIIQEGIEIMVDLAQSKRETLLETTIIILIAFEIILSIIKWS